MAAVLDYAVIAFCGETLIPVFHIGYLLNYLKKEKPKDAFCIVGITMIDLYPKDSWNFVFGQASLTEGMWLLPFKFSG